MAAKNLTARFCESVRPVEGKQTAYPDADARGLELRVSGEGRKVWTFRYRLDDGKQRRLTLGLWAPGEEEAPNGSDEAGPKPLTLREARKAARAARASVDAGQDPAGAKQARKAAARAEPIKTFDDLFNAYIAACERGRWTPKGKVKRARSISDEKAAYRLYIKPTIGAKALEQVTRGAVRDLLEALTDRGITAQANKAQQVIRQAFNYALDRERVTVNPALGLKAAAPISASDRVLTDTELQALWKAIHNPAGLKSPDGDPVYLSRPMAIALSLCALLLLRRNEVIGMRVSELDLDHALWLIPGERMKNGQPHLVPLPPRAIELIREAITLADLRSGEKGRPNDAPVFPGARDQSKPMRPDSVTHSMQAVVEALKLKPASPHDLRRTGSTLMTSERLRISHFVRSLVLSHTTDTGGGAAVSSAHYDRNAYVTEKRAALTAWERLLLEIVGERPVETIIRELRAQ